MKDYHINIFYSEEDEGYVADIPDLKYCSAFGESLEKALPCTQMGRVMAFKALTKLGV